MLVRSLAHVTSASALFLVRTSRSIYKGQPNLAAPSATSWSDFLPLRRAQLQDTRNKLRQSTVFSALLGRLDQQLTGNESRLSVGRYAPIMSRVGALEGCVKNLADSDLDLAPVRTAVGTLRQVANSRFVCVLL